MHVCVGILKTLYSTVLYCIYSLGVTSLGVTDVLNVTFISVYGNSIAIIVKFGTKNIYIKHTLQIITHQIKKKQCFIMIIIH